jgi:Uma2 family endonuclease
MNEYVANGARVGWVMDPKSKRVWVFTAAGFQILEQPGALSGDPILPGFMLDLTDIFSSL